MNNVCYFFFVVLLDFRTVCCSNNCSNTSFSQNKMVKEKDEREETEKFCLVNTNPSYPVI